MSGCLAKAPEMENPACRSSPTSINLQPSKLFSVFAASIVKDLSADTCASNKVEIWRERMTISLLETFSKKDIDKIDLLSWSSALYLNSIPYEVKVYLLVLLKLNNNQNFSSHKNI